MPESPGFDRKTIFSCKKGGTGTSWYTGGSNTVEEKKEVEKTAEEKPNTARGVKGLKKFLNQLNKD